MTESGAITLHVAEQHPDAGLLPAPGTRERAITLRWLMYAVNTLQPAGRRLFYPERFSVDESHADGINKRAEENLLSSWKWIETHAIGDGPFVLGDRYTVADIYMVMMSAWSDDSAQLRRDYPKIERMFDAAVERPATQRILTVHGEL